MVPAGEGSGMQVTQITKNYLLNIKEDLKKHLSTLIDHKLDPMVEQISTLSSTIKEVATMANATHEENEKNGGLIKALQTSERQLKERTYQATLLITFFTLMKGRPSYRWRGRRALWLIRDLPFSFY